MIVVFDASAAVKLVLDEAGSDVARTIWDEADAVVAPTIMTVEVAAAITAAVRAGRIDARAARTAHQIWADLAGTFDHRVVDAVLATAASDIAVRATVRGMDAIYVAVTAELDDPDAPAALASFDVKQREAAVRAGRAVLPAWIAAERATQPD